MENKNNTANNNTEKIDLLAKAITEAKGVTMENSIFEKMAATKDNELLSENGNVGFKTTFNPLVDMNFKIPMFRDTKEHSRRIWNYDTDERETVTESNLPLLHESLDKIISDVQGNKYLLKYLFYARDVREGLGERNFFRESLKYLMNKDFKNKDAIIETIIKLIPEYGRYDDLFIFMDTQYESILIKSIDAQLTKDSIDMRNNKPISLLAKWLPSENTTSKTTVELAKRIRKSLGDSAKDYRKMLSKFRAYLNVTETYTSANKWSEINYNEVPSNANIKYNSAFLRHDEDRRRQYLEDLANGKEGVKINSAVNYPYQIISQYTEGGSWSSRAREYDEGLEQLWKNLKQIASLDSTLPIRDGSGSMCDFIFGSKTTKALDVATGLTIYCAERLSKDLKDRFITFSHEAQLIDLSKCKSLHDKLIECYKYDDCSNTDILNVFRLLLKTAKQFKLSQEDFPRQLLIISDMEFDGCRFNADGNVFEQAKKEYKEAGYKLPRLVFWNVNSRTGSIPVLENENGVLLISGFSVNLLEMVLGGKDTYAALIEKLTAERYNNVPYLEF